MNKEHLYLFFSRFLKIIVFITLFSPFILFSQSYNFRKITIRDGMAENASHQLMIDYQDYLWVGTYEKGVSRYNGHTFTHYNTKNGLPDNQIFDVIQARNKHVWVATANGIAEIYGNKTNTYISYGTENSKIVAISEDITGKIWFCAEKGNIGYIENGDIIMYQNDRLRTLTKTTLFTDTKGRVWVGTTDGGIFMYNGQSYEFYDSYSGMPETPVRCIAEIDNQIYIGFDNGLYVIDQKQYVKQYVSLYLDNVPIYSVFQDKNKNLWLGSERGVYVVRNKILTHFSAPNGIDGAIYDIVQDKDNGMFFASTLGLYHLPNEFFITFQATHGLLSDNIYALQADAKNNIWVATSKGVNIITTENKITTHDQLPKLTTEKSYKIATDSQHTIYIALQNKLYIQDGNRFKVFQDNVFRQQNDKYATDEYTALFVRKNGEVLLGNEAGINVYKNGHFEKLLTQDELKGAVPSVISEDSKERIWIGTKNAGIFVYQEGSLTHISKKDGLICETITDILPFQETVLATTLKNGICKIQYPLVQVTYYEELELSSSNTTAISIDKTGNIWVGTDRGIDKILIWENDDMWVQNFGEDEGLHTLEINRSAMIKDLLGNIWVGTSEGVTKINLKEKPFTEKTPATYITGVQLFFTPIDWAEYSKNYVPSFEIPTYFALPSDKNNITFEFVGLTFHISDKMKYQWKLQGVDKDWVPATFRNEATYTNLTSGNYTFQVRAITSDGRFSEKIASINFEITKPFYQTRVFYFIIFCFIMGGAYLLLRFRIKYLEKVQNELSKKVKERTAEIEKQKTHMKVQSEKLALALEEIDIKNKELTDFKTEMSNSLEYAKKIQSSIFSYHDDLTRHFPQSFVLQIPKKIVFGDFLWVKPVTENRIFIAVADCTGSGVPAAFLSLISNDCLNQIIVEHSDIDPAALLYELDKRIRGVLKHAEEDNLNDGLDIAVCAIDKTNHTLTFSGAKRPLCYVKNGQLEIIKADFCSVGINFMGVNPEFENTVISLDEATTVYLFSDGFPNQFGGIENKKYKITKFKKLLTRISRMKTDTQLRILRDEFKEWKGDEAQIDDVLVVGFQYEPTPYTL
jgi:ligand-binding sensor domain-containing protein/serine phosphatase RsbU (regulator of sigma subunit)